MLGLLQHQISHPRRLRNKAKTAVLGSKPEHSGGEVLTTGLALQQRYTARNRHTQRLLLVAAWELRRYTPWGLRCAGSRRRDGRP